MRTSILPAWPHFVFAVLEPLFCLGAWLLPFNNGLARFITDQLPSSLTPSNPINPSSLALARQLSNVFGVLGALAIGVLYYSREPAVVRNYIFCLTLSDIGHLWAVYAAIGTAGILDVRGWNALGWGNIFGTVFLFVNRVLYLVGVFGDPRDLSSNADLGEGERKTRKD